MKKVFLGFLLIIGLVSCDSTVVYEGKTFSNYEMYVDYSINHLKSPVILFGVTQYKTNYSTYYSIIVKDGNGIIKYYNSDSGLVNVIGSTYKLGETIR